MYCLQLPTHLPIGPANLLVYLLRPLLALVLGCLLFIRLRRRVARILIHGRGKVKGRRVMIMARVHGLSGGGRVG